MVMFALFVSLLAPQEPASPGPVKAKPAPDEATYVAIEDVPLPDRKSVV